MYIDEEKPKEYFDSYLQLAIETSNKGQYTKKHFSYAEIEL